MSSKLHGLVWECEIQPISRKAVIARLADFSSDEGYSWPSVDTIRRQVGAKSKNTVAAAIKELEKDGWLTVVPRKSGGRDISNGYQLNVEKIETAADESRQSTKQVRAKANSKFNPSNIDPSDSDHSKTEGSKKVKSGGQNLVGEGSTVDPDPLLDPTTDPSNKKPSCPVAAQPDPEVVITDQAIEVLTHLNQVSGSRFQKSKTSLENIRARIREGYSVSDLKLVIDLKHEHWHDNDEQYQYMRPETLFGPKKFESYLQSATRWESRGRPAREDWDKSKKQATQLNSYSQDAGIDTTERDLAWRRYHDLEANNKPKSEVEVLVRAKADRDGLKAQGYDHGLAKFGWNNIWSAEAGKGASS